MWKARCESNCDRVASSLLPPLILKGSSLPLSLYFQKRQEATRQKLPRYSLMGVLRISIGKLEWSDRGFHGL